ncbi:MAG: RagB/SusD family nutrient uptake outer membrane protein [Capnocytophaga sp.]|nr:RagB/SusD family nutrient uptake outer membrane protein [Capnocytophaga sp.]
MKHYFICLSVMLAGLTACSLDEDPKYDLNTQTVFSSTETAESVLLQAYGHLADFDLYGSLLLNPTSGNGVMIGQTNGNSLHRASSYNVDPTDDTWLGAPWRKVYKVIAESNYLIAGLSGSSLPETYKAEAIAHARFLRGYSYYLIASLWGNAPLITEPITSDKLHTPLSPRKAVYAQAESDLLFAAENLPETGRITGGGTADRNAAKAFVTKLYFMLASQKQADMDTSDYTASELWTKVKQTGTPLVGKYSLETDFATLFAPHSAGSKESIFQLNYSPAAGVRKRWTFLFAPMGFASYNSFKTIRINKGFYDLHVGTHPGDKRIEVSYMNQYENQRNVAQFAYPYVLINGAYVNLRDYMKPGSDPKNPEYDFDDPAMPAALRNLWKSTVQGTMGDRQFPFNGKGCDKNSAAGYDSTNTLLFRYADLLLILADAENELDNQAAAIGYVNQVLNRAGLASVAAMSKEDFRDFVFFERMFELVGEPVLYEDVRRRGTEYLKKVIEIQNNSWLVNYRFNLETNAGITGGAWNEMLINNKNLTDDFLRKAMVLPIPQSEINYNEKLTQADQNFGY